MTETTLLAWLSGGLEPGTADEIAALVRADPLLAARAAVLRPLLEAPPVDIGWRIPPPGLPGGMRPIAMQALRMTMDAGPIPPLGGFSIRIEPGADADARWVVVLWIEDGRWSVAFPTCIEERLRLSALPVEPDGSRLLDLIAGEAVGTQRWAVALPVADAQWDAADPWGALRDALAAGEVPVTAVSVVVAG